MVDGYKSTKVLKMDQAAKAMRNAIGVAGDSAAAKAAGALLNPAENYGGIMSFRIVALLSIVLTIIFGGLFLSDKAKGGYKAERIS